MSQRTFSKAELRDQLRARWALPSTSTGVLVADPDQAAAAGDQVPEPQRAFVLHAESGRTVITAPLRQVASDNEAFTYLTGRLVGADTPNRNGAMWTSADLELGQGTVAGGPLNWLHDETKIIGCLLSGAFVGGDSELANVNGGQPYGVGPHIATTAAVWSFLFPNETAFITKAAADGELYYSMECVSREVACIDTPGRPGCGAQVPYADYNVGRCCAHLRDRSAVRRFVDPLFLGAAVIVPPIRPGWADANVDIARQAAAVAEEQMSEVAQVQAREIAAAILTWANR